MDDIVYKYMNIKKYGRFNKVDYLIKDREKTLSKIRNNREAIKTFRSRYTDFDDYVSEIIPLINYAIKDKRIIRIKHTGLINQTPSHDGEIIYQNENISDVKEILKFK